jgi:hypothetical protein
MEAKLGDDRGAVVRAPDRIIARQPTSALGREQARGSEL